MKLARILHAAYFTPGLGGWGLPLFFEGMPGIAKSTIIRDFAASIDAPCEVLSGAERGEGAFGVVPVPDLQRGVMTYPAPDWAARFGGGGLVFLDEISSNPPIIQAPCMGLMLDRRIGSHQFGKRVRVWAAMNPASVATNGFDISMPLANRGGWVTWPAPTVEEHVAYMLGRVSGSNTFPGVDQADEELRVEREWPAAFARAIGFETSFLGAQADWKNKPPKAGSMQAGRAWPSDRSWEMATRALAGAYVHGLSDVDRDTFVGAFVGGEAYEAFGTFIEQQDLPNAADVLDGRVKFKHDKRQSDRTAALLNGCAALVVPKNATLRKERAAALWTLMLDVGGDMQDVLVPVACALINENLHVVKAAVPMLAKINPALEAAGVSAGRGAANIV